MRRKLNRQTNLFTTVSNNPIARELEEISKIIDANPGVLDLVYQDLVKAKRHDTGREGSDRRTGAALLHPEAIPPTQL